MEPFTISWYPAAGSLGTWEGQSSSSLSLGVLLPQELPGRPPDLPLQCLGSTLPSLVPKPSADLEGTQGDKVYLSVDGLQELLHLRPGHSFELLHPALGQYQPPQRLAELLLGGTATPSA